jgi:tetratricopeptide (TPR) repeat protein
MSTATAPPNSSPWIVSARWDLAFIVATPVLVIPLAMLLIDRAMTPDQFAVAVFAFATVGHHMPGYLRAYGDRELFQRFRWRFLLAPPVIYLTALAFVDPRMLGFGIRSLNSLGILMLFWGLWHGTMQTYGFMRMYDVKQGVTDRLTARLNLLACFSVFAGGLIFCDTRVYNVMQILFSAGLPPFGPEWLTRAREAAGLVLCVVGTVYFLNAARSGHLATRGGQMKVLLVASTGLIYWWSGVVTTYLLVGLALFEIFHAIQYYAIVWTYNRKREQRLGDGFGPLRFLFRGSGSSLALYLGFCMAFGGIFYLSGAAIGSPTYGKASARSIFGDSFSLLTALFVASSLLHYYLDGFIWKVRESATSEDLGLDVRQASTRKISVPALFHLGKWGLLYLALAGLAAVELPRPIDSAGIEARDRMLARWLPSLPEAQSALVYYKIEGADTAGAVTLAREVVGARPGSHAAQASFGRALFEHGDYEESLEAFANASALASGDWRYVYYQASALAELGRKDEAEEFYLMALDLQPDAALVHRQLGWLWLQQQRYALAEQSYRRALELEPDHAVGQYNLGQALLGQHRKHEARVHLERAQQLRGLEQPGGGT